MTDEVDETDKPHDTAAHTETTKDKPKAKRTTKLKPRSTKLRLAAANGITLARIERDSTKGIVVDLSKSARVRDSNGCTVQQESFARSVGLDGLTLSDAYRKHYKTSANIDSIHKLAFRLSKLVHVASRITYWHKQRTANASHSAEQIRAFILETLTREAQDMNSKPADRLKATELLGKVDYVGMFRERTVTETAVPDDPAALREEIDALLKDTG